MAQLISILLETYFFPFTFLSLFGLLFLNLFSTDYFFKHFFKKTALNILLILLFLSLILGITMDLNSFNFVCIYSLGSFIKSINFKLGFDGISFLFVFLTLLIITLCFIFNWDNITTNNRSYYAALLTCCLFLIITFTTLDIFLFYFFFESVVVPVFLMIGIWGSRIRRIYASYAFILYTLFGSLLMFIGLLYFLDRIGNTDYIFLTNTNKFLGFTFGEQKYLWLAFFLTFGAKIPMVPVHIWLPEAHVEAPTTGSVILASILLKLGVYGFLRYSLIFFPWACFYYLPLIFTLCCLGIVYGSLTALRQIDFKRIIAYASIAHMNMIVLGIFCDQTIGLEGAILQSLSHGFVSSALFFLIGILYERYHTRIISYYSGLVYIMPIYVGFFFFFSLANIGFPLTANFVGEFLILNGLIGTNFFITLISSLGMLLGAAYSLRLYNKISFGNLHEKLCLVIKDLSKKEIFILVLLTVFTILAGICPRIFLMFVFERSHIFTYFT